MKIIRSMHKSIKTQSKQNVTAVKKRKCDILIDSQIIVMMRRKILFWANLVSSGFTLDVKA